MKFSIKSKVMKNTLFLFTLLYFCTVGFSQSTTVDIGELKKNNDVFYLKDKPFTGNCYGKHKNGQIGLKGQFTNGKKEGLWIWWYSDGTKKRETTYSKNLKEGMTVYWHPNGIKSKEIIYKEDKNIDQKLWDDKGNRLPNPTFNQSY